MELSETGGRTIRRTRSSADCKLRGKTEPNEPLNDRALKLIISHRFKLAGARRSMRCPRRLPLMNLAVD